VRADSTLFRIVLPRVLVIPAHEVMQGEGNFVGMRRAPCDDALEFERIIGDGADFDQLVFNGLRVSHRIQHGTPAKDPRHPGLVSAGGG
jgi:hypothetical protein